MKKKYKILIVLIIGIFIQLNAQNIINNKTITLTSKNCFFAKQFALHNYSDGLHPCSNFKGAGSELDVSSIVDGKNNLPTNSNYFLSGVSYSDSVNTGSELIFDFGKPIALSKIEFWNVQEYQGVNNILFDLYTSYSAVGPWVKVERNSFNQTSSQYPTQTLLKSKSISQFYRIKIISPSYSYFVKCSNQTFGFNQAQANIMIGEIYFYENPLLNSSSNIITDNKCVTIKSNAEGETYLWSTGETTQSIQVCNAGTYTCQVTNTSFTGNQDHVASISIDKIESQDSLPSPNGEVYSIFKNGNTVYYGGDFNAVGPVTGSSAYIDNVTGQPKISLPRVNGTINTTISDNVGGWYVGGKFTKVGNYAIANLAHIKADNTVDTTFKPQPNGSVLSMVLNGSSFYVGGEFTTIQGIANNYVAKIDKNTGAPILWSAQSNGIVRSITLANDLIILGGDFTSVGGQARNYLASLDTVYVQARAWNPNPNNKVYKVYATATKLYVGGDFTSISGIAKGYGAGYSLPGYTLDGYNFGANGRIHDFILNNNVLYVAGLFTSISGSSRNYLAGLNPLNVIPNSFNATADGIVRSLAISGGNLIVGGDFSTIGGQSRNRLAALNVTTGVATAWNPSIIGEKLINPTVNTVATSGNAVYVGGTFYSVGATIRNNAAAIDATTGQILPWNPNTNGIVRAIAADNSNVYLGGDFTTVNGTVTKNRIAQVNAITGVATGWNPNADNSVNTLILTNNSLYVGGNFANIGGAARSKFAVLSSLTGSATAFNPAPNGNVNALAITGDTLYIGGDFSTIGGQTRNRLASYQLSNSTLLAFNPNINATVSALASTKSKLYVGGAFSLVGSSLRYNFAEIDIVTGNATSLNTNVINGSSVNSIAIQDSSVYSGGGYQYYNSGQPISNLATIKTQSGLLGYWQPQPDDIIRTIVLGTNKAYVGGRFKQINSRYQPFFASLDIYNSGSAPVITSVPNVKGCIGASLEINGSGFTNIMEVKIGETSVPFVVNSSTSITITPTTALTGKVKVVNVLGSPISSESVTINALPSATITASGATSFCQGGSVTLSSSAGSSYLWSTGATTANIAPTTTGNYTVQVTDVNGCSKTSSAVNITVNSLPTVIATASKTAVCSGDNVTLIGSGASTYTWDNNVSNGVSFVPSSTKTYTVTGTDANGCKNTANVLVTVNTLPTVTANSNKSVVCSGDNVTLTGSGASTYSWDNNVTNGVSFVPSSTKTYMVTGTDANGCNNTASVSVSVNSLPTIAANATKTSICPGDNVTLAGTGASTYSWDNNVSNGVSFIPNATKTYTVTGTDANGCKNTASILVTVNSLPTVVANASKTAICTGDNVTLTGIGASTYTWDNNVSNGVSFVPSTTKTYTVTGTDANGCKNTANILVTVNTLPTVTANSNKSVVCSGDNVTLTGTGASTYVWDNNVTNGVSFVPSATKTYTVTGTDANGCKNTANVLVTVNALPTVVATVTKTAMCPGDNVTLTGSGASTYVWDNNVTNGVSFVPSVTKTYTVTGTDVNGCKNTANVLVTVNALPTVVATASKTAVCTGDNITLTGTGATTYSWDNNVSNGVSFVPSVTKTYTVTGTDANGCKNTANVLVTVNSLPTVIANSNKSVVCSGDNVTLTGSGASTYTWDNNVSNGVSFAINTTKTYSVTGTDANGCKNTSSVSISVNSLPIVVANTSKTAVCTGDNVTLTGNGASTYAWDNNVSNGVSFVPSATKTYTVTGTDANGCKNTSNVLVTVNALPTVVANATKTAICLGDNVTLTGSGASTYVWDNNVSNGVSFVANATKTYSVTGTDVNGCKNTANVIVTVNTLPTVIANSNKSVVCLGDNVTLTGTGASAYAWDNNVSNGVSFVPSATKTYIVTGTDANGCKNTANVLVTVNTSPTVIATATKTVVCSGESVTLTGTGASTYVWDNNVINGVSFVPSVTKTYTVTGTDANGCFKAASISVAINNIPTVQIVSSNPTNKACEDANLELTTDVVGSYLWSNGEKTKNIYPIKSGVYSLNFTDNNGCSNTSNSIKVTIFTLPTVSITLNGNSTYCSTNLTELVSTTAASYLWNSGETTKSIKPTQTGSYFVKITDINGCSQTSQPVDIIVNNCAGIENLDNLFIKTYPNPVTDYLMIEINETLVGKNYFVTDVAGKLLISGSFEKTINQIDFNQYASGSYMIHINEQTFKFIKE